MLTLINWYRSIKTAVFNGLKTPTSNSCNIWNECGRSRNRHILFLMQWATNFAEIWLSWPSHMSKHIVFIGVNWSKTCTNHSNPRAFKVQPFWLAPRCQFKSILRNRQEGYKYLVAHPGPLLSAQLPITNEHHGIRAVAAELHSPDVPLYLPSLPISSALAWFPPHPQTGKVCTICSQPLLDKQPDGRVVPWPVGKCDFHVIECASVHFRCDWNRWSFCPCGEFCAGCGGVRFRFGCGCCLPPRLETGDSRKCWHPLATFYLNLGLEIVPSTLKTDEFPDEKWFFINGILVGDYWLESAIDKLSMLFKRKVYGIRNKT